MYLPNDPAMLMSVVNMKLRDEYASIDQLCNAYGVSRDELVEKLKNAGFDYIPGINQFR